MSLSLTLLVPNIWSPADTLPQWAAWLIVAATVWAYHFVLGSKPDAIRREEERRRDETLEMMAAVLEYTSAEDAKPEEERKLPETERVLKLLWDETHGVRTLAWGISPTNEMYIRCEELYKRVSLSNLRKAIFLTRRSRVPGAIQTAAKDDMKKLTEHASGEKLNELLKHDKKVRKKMGRAFAADHALRREANDLLRLVYRDQSKNARQLLGMVWPVLPHVIYATCIGMLHTALRSKFHQIGIWVMTIEAGAEGNMPKAVGMLFNLWVGHMLIKCIELPEFTYTRRSKATFGNIIRNGVLSAMVRQDYEYFDRTPAGVLQDRLNRDADELGENLIGFPKEMLNRLVWVTSNMVQVWLMAPPRFFCVACAPVLLMCTFQFFTFKFFRECSERARRVEEEGISATSEVLRQIKTVRQFAAEQKAAATFARRNLARQLVGERITTFKRALEVIVWCIFDSGICLTIIFGLPYVQSGEMSAGMLIDCFCKLNFNVNFCLREIMEELPRMARLLEPMGRICDLLQARPTIEPPAHPAFVDAANAAELGALLAACNVAVDEKGITRLTLTRDDVASRLAADGAAATPEGATPAVGSQLVFLSSKDHRLITPFELVDEPSVAASATASTARVPSGLTYPVRAVFSNKLRPTRFRGHIEFADVHFSYPTDLRKPVLQGISYMVEPGEKVALVGPTGCGKSSCMSLLQRLYEPSSGTIKLDGIALAEYDLHNLRSRVVIVDQSTVLFSRSIKENICYGMDRPVSEAEIIEACVRAHAWEFICEKPDKLITHLTGGSNLSGGQRQRLAIARAILRNPDVILLDEATSALDNENEAKVQRALDELARHGSSLVIAHRLSTIRDADKIVVVDHGRAVEIGTHDELLCAGTLPTLSTKPVPTEQPCSRTITPPTSKSDSERGQSDNEDGESPPPPVRRARSASSSTTFSLAGGDGVQSTGATYRKLWDAATGGGAECTSLAGVGAKIERMESELAELRVKRASMLQTKRQLVGELGLSRELSLSLASTDIADAAPSAAQIRARASPTADKQGC